MLLKFLFSLKMLQDAESQQSFCQTGNTAHFVPKMQWNITIYISSILLNMYIIIIKRELLILEIFL